MNGGSQQMNYCGECGNKVDSTIKFCTNCGTPLEENKTTTNNNEIMNEDTNKEGKKMKQQHPSPLDINKSYSYVWPRLFGLIAFIGIAIVGFYIASSVDNIFDIFASDNNNDDDNTLFVDDSTYNDDNEEDEVDKETELYEYSKVLPEKLTNPDDSIAETDTFGYEVYSFTQKEFGVYYFETDKGEYLLRVREHSHPDDPAHDLLFGTKKTWFIEDWYTNEPIMRSVDWDDYND